jgi:predicted dehydrogenase
VIRRTFLSSSAAALAAGAQAQSVPIGAGIIGTGNRGSYVLRQVLATGGVKVTALCDIKPDRLDKAASAAARDNPVTLRDYKELLSRSDVDAVHVATPCDLHVEMAIAALKAGKHVYLEKPAGIDGPSIKELLRVARTSNRVVIVGQQLRSSKRLQTLIARIHEGLLGDILFIKAQRHSNNDLAHDGPSADWFFDVKRSGDVLVEMSVHNLDVCNWAVQQAPERASGFGGTLLWKNDPPGRNTMDGYTVSYEYPNGAKLSYTQVFFQPRGMPAGSQYWYIYGSKGAVDVQSGVFYPRDMNAKPETIAEPAEEKIDLWHVEAFYESIRTGKKPPCDLETGARAALTAILGREAIYQKRVTQWSEFGADL